MTQTNISVATVVLVHAAWADASSWNKIIPPLQRRGVEAGAVQIPLTSLSDDAAILRRFLKRVSGPVVLVGHSYGGAVITAAATGNPNVKALVYIAAMAPDEGETVGELLHRAAPHASAPALVPDEDGLLWMSAKGFADAVAHESSADDALLMAATQKPVAVECVQEKMTKPAWKEKPSWFLLADQDRMIAPETQRFMADRTGGHVYAMEVDHTPLASAPDEVVAVINKAVDTVAHRAALMRAESEDWHEGRLGK
ncbi:MAG: alpha/beta hydrolase [Acidobacteria bacterium]|nr:alpha/beta hydrolase [Acidobacteriota bacterium]MBV9483139.1 alpha/beta hydrolase [Acidobacteriota bacterium]